MRQLFYGKEPGLEVIKLEFILRLKIKCNDWLLADTCPQAANIELYFKSGNVLKFYNHEARSCLRRYTEHVHVDIALL